MRAYRNAKCHTDTVELRPATSYLKAILPSLFFFIFCTVLRSIVSFLGHCTGNRISNNSRPFNICSVAQAHRDDPITCRRLLGPIRVALRVNEEQLL